MENNKNYTRLKTTCNAIISTIFIGLLVYMAFELLYNNKSFSVNYLLAYFGTMFFSLIWLLQERVIKFSMSTNGISAELQKAKADVLATKEEFLHLYKKFLELAVLLAENSSRWAGWNEARRSQLMHDIFEECKQLNVSDIELNKIFSSKTFWDAIDRISPIKNQIESNLENPETKALLNAEFEDLINTPGQTPTANWLEKYLEQTSLQEQVKKSLRDAINNIPVIQKYHQ